MAAPRRERKVVTVLFADLVGFTSRAERMDPEDVAAELEAYQARVRRELERYGGTVEKFIGDAAMAVFGAPVAHEDDPERAVRAALAIRDWARDEDVEVRIGVNTGEALVTVGARPEAGETMAAGDVVNTAARLQSAAPVGGIAVGDQTFRATERAVDYRELEPVAAKGKAEPVLAWQAVAARSRVAVDRVHGAGLVGRERELALLEAALGRATEERAPQLVTLVGVPGIGKSRLVLELYEAVERRPELISWRQGRCLPYGDGVTFWALGEMVKAQAGILEGDGADEAARKLAAVSPDGWVESHLRPLVGLGGGAEGGDRRDEAFAAWRRFFEGLAESRPLVLVFEDLHWADDNLLDFVDDLVEWVAGVPLLVVCTARPELLTRRPGWGGGKPNALTISLPALSDEDTARLLGELLGAVLPAETQVELLARAGGNPLYAEEFARMLRDRGRVAELPETVQGLIAARLDLLEPEQKSLLQNAAVVGKRFWTGALVSLGGGDGAALEPILHALERREFVGRERSSSVLGDREYAFRHLLVRDVAYGQLPRAVRAEKHLRAAEWIERLGRREDHAEMLAFHYLQALELGAAAGLDTGAFAEAAQAALAQAGDRASALNAYEAAARYYRSALDLLPQQDERRYRLLLALGANRVLVGEPAVDLLEEARDGLLAAGDAEGAGEAETMLAEHVWLDGDRTAAFRHLDRARELVDPLPLSRVKARAVGMASRSRMLAGDDAEAVRLGLEALAMAEELGLDDVRVAVLTNVGSARLSAGDERGFDDLDEAVRLAGAANAPYELCRAMGNRASFLWTAGRLREAIALWREADEEAKRFGQVGFGRWFTAVLVNPLYATGRWDEAQASAEAFIADVEAGRPHYLASQVYSCRALIRAARGDDEAALADAEEARVLATRAGDPQALLPAMARLAHVRAELGDLEGAATAAGEFVSALRSGRGIGFAISSAHELSWTLQALGRGPELVAALRGHPAYPWVEAAIAFTNGEPVRSADICGGVGNVAAEAFCRLAAARLGNLSQLEPALAFYRAVGAKRYVGEGEGLLAASA